MVFIFIDCYVITLYVIITLLYIADIIINYNNYFSFSEHGRS